MNNTTVEYGIPFCDVGLGTMFGCTQVWPINHFPDANINRASNELVNKHHRAYPNERMLMQVWRWAIKRKVYILTNIFFGRIDLVITY